jgi:hypothetical protein
MNYASQGVTIAHLRDNFAKYLLDIRSGFVLVEKE